MARKSGKAHWDSFRRTLTRRAFANRKTFISRVVFLIVKATAAYASGWLSVHFNEAKERERKNCMKKSSLHQIFLMLKVCNKVCLQHKFSLLLSSSFFPFVSKQIPNGRKIERIIETLNLLNELIFDFIIGFFVVDFIGFVEKWTRFRKKFSCRKVWCADWQTKKSGVF